MQRLYKADSMNYYRAGAILKTGRADIDKVLETPAQDIYFSILNDLRVKCYQAQANKP